jgi:hypothetical protein
MFLKILKRHGNEADFLGFFRNWFLIDPLHYLSSRFDFGFEFGELFKIEKQLLLKTTRLLNVKKKTRQVGESATPSLAELLW